MPQRSIDRATNFIVGSESWAVVEYDNTSVPGVIYLSLTEGKVNLIYDDLENNIADTDKLAQYTLSVPSEIQVFSVGDIVQPVFTLMKNGIPSNADVEFISKNKNIIKQINGVLTAVGEGETELIVQLKDIPNITNVISIQVGGEANFSAYIKGSETIRLDRESVYELVGTAEMNQNVIFSINNTTFAKITSVENNICTIHANDKNLLGSFILTASYNGVDYTKTINVIPLW